MKFFKVLTLLGLIFFAGCLKKNLNSKIKSGEIVVEDGGVNEEKFLGDDVSEGRNSQTITINCRCIVKYMEKPAYQTCKEKPTADCTVSPWVIKYESELSSTYKCNPLINTTVSGFVNIGAGTKQFNWIPHDNLIITKCAESAITSLKPEDEEEI